MAIIQNSARCLVCNEDIISKDTHDYVTCSCGNLSVDGGFNYLKRGFQYPDKWEDTSKTTQFSVGDFAVVTKEVGELSVGDIVEVTEFNYESGGYVVTTLGLLGANNYQDVTEEQISSTLDLINQSKTLNTPDLYVVEPLECYFDGVGGLSDIHYLGDSLEVAQEVALESGDVSDEDIIVRKLTYNKEYKTYRVIEQE